jgi:hypothetical protein
MNSPQTRGLGLCICFTAGLHLRLSLSHTLSQHSTSTLLPEPERHGFTTKCGYLCVSLGVDQTPLLPPEAGLNLNQGSYQSDEQGSQAFLSSFVWPKLASLVHQERGSFPLDQHGLVVPGRGNPPCGLGSLSW